MRYLSAAEYDGILLIGLMRLGLTRADATRLIAARWPMDAHGLVSEAHGRGLVVSLDGIAEWLAATIGPTWADGQPVDVGHVMFTASIGDRCFSWLAATGRATATLTGELMARDTRPLDALLDAAHGGEN